MLIFQGVPSPHFWLRFQSWAAACSLWEEIFDKTLGGGFKYFFVHPYLGK